MPTLNVYLNFDGNTREAMEFYAQLFGGKLDVKRFSDGPPELKECVPPDAADRVMHAHLAFGDTVIMASDAMPGMPFQRGNNYWLNMLCDTREEVQRLHGALSEGGQVQMPVQDVFWDSYFGMCTDRFGTNWMLQKPGQPQG